MTIKDKTIQDLRRYAKGLEEELKLAVESCRLCRFCEHRDEDCSPTGHDCRPKWRHYEH